MTLSVPFSITIRFPARAGISEASTLPAIGDSYLNKWTIQPFAFLMLILITIFMEVENKADGVAIGLWENQKPA